VIALLESASNFLAVAVACVPAEVRHKTRHADDSPDYFVHPEGGWSPTASVAQSRRMTTNRNHNKARVWLWVLAVGSAVVILGSLGLILFGGSTNWFTPVGSFFTLLAAIGMLVGTRDQKESPGSASSPAKPSSDNEAGHP
jgi:hypothetical protein